MRGCPSNSQPTKASRLSSSSKEFIFPVDLLIEILKRLPLESLIRLTLVCKSWFSLLTSPIFISAHVSHNSFTKTNDGQSKKFHLFKPAINVQITEGFNPSIFSLYDEKNLSKQCEIECPVGRNHFVVSSHDGLLCLFDFYSKNPKSAPLILWNPSIQRTKVVPVPADGSLDLTPWGFPQLIFGFGFDSLSSEYKVVRVAYFNCGSRVTRFLANVYGLGVGKWKSLDMTSVPRNFATIRWRGVCLNGVIHWISNMNVSFDDSNLVLRSILTFKLGSEKFGEIELPKELSSATGQTVRVLTVPKSCKEVLGVIHNFDKFLSLWVMEDYGSKESWAKLFSINTLRMPENDMNVMVLSEDVVVVKTWSGSWISCDVMRERRNGVWSISDRHVYVDPFVESLILLTQGNGVSSGKEMTRGRMKRKGSGQRRTRKPKQCKC